MNITKIYYEELRSEQINGKWTSKKIGAETNVDGNNSYEDSLRFVKNYVRNSLDFEMMKPKDYIDNKRFLRYIKELNKKIEEIIESGD